MTSAKITMDFFILTVFKLNRLTFINSYHRSSTRTVQCILLVKDV